MGWARRQKSHGQSGRSGARAETVRPCRSWKTVFLLLANKVARFSLRNPGPSAAKPALGLSSWAAFAVGSKASPREGWNLSLPLSMTRTFASLPSQEPPKPTAQSLSAARIPPNDTPQTQSRRSLSSVPLRQGSACPIGMVRCSRLGSMASRRQSERGVLV
jgi:hypothetical protein